MASNSNTYKKIISMNEYITFIYTWNKLLTNNWNYTVYRKKSHSYRIAHNYFKNFKTSNECNSNNNKTKVIHHN